MPLAECNNVPRFSTHFHTVTTIFTNPHGGNTSQGTLPTHTYPSQQQTIRTGIFNHTYFVLLHDIQVFNPRRHLVLSLGLKPRLRRQTFFTNPHGDTKVQAQATPTKYIPGAIFNCASPQSFLILYTPAAILFNIIHTCRHHGSILFNIIHTCRHLLLRLAAILDPSFLIVYTPTDTLNCGSPLSWIHPF